MTMSKFSKYSAALNLSVHKIPPPIPFVSKVQKMEKVNVPDADNIEWIKLDFCMDPDNPASKYLQQFSIFKDGCPEDWIKWVMDFCKIEILIHLKDPVDRQDPGCFGLC
jgi:hypothetical protein